MIPQRIVEYLNSRAVGYQKLTRPTTLAESQPIAAWVPASASHVARCAVIEAEAERYLAVYPWTEELDELRLAHALRARSVRVLDATEYTNLFPECAVGAEPPFGKLFDIPVVLDETLADRNESIVFLAGSLNEAIEMRYIDYERIERPIVAGITHATGERAAETAAKEHELHA